MKKEIRILYVEDVPAEVVMVSHELRMGGLAFRTKRVETRDAFIHELELDTPDLILCDHGLPSFDGFTALAIARDKCPQIPFIFVTGSLGEQVAIETFESGATDYVLKSRLAKLVPAVQRALREAQERTALREKDQALRESEESFRLLVEGVKDYAIYMLDPEGRVATWNAGAERLEGYRAEEVLGQHLSIFFTSPDVEHGVAQEALRRAEEQGQVTNEGWRVRKDGSRFWTVGILTALRDESGRLRGFAKVAHDMTARKETEEEIQRLNEGLERRVVARTAQLEATNQELEAFSYSVSHDLRAPLRHIAGYAEILRADCSSSLNEQGKSHLNTISEAARQMGTLIDALLEFSRMGRAGMIRQPVSLAALVEDARRQLHREMQGRQIDWQLGDLPQVRGDPIMLRQVIINLLSNALKYTRSRPHARIEVGATRGEEETVFFVRDNGVGFDMRYAEKLFGVFQRLHSPSEFEGTGIGLANVRRIIHRHGGRAWAEGAVDRGATFYIALPHTTHQPREDNDQLQGERRDETG